MTQIFFPWRRWNCELWPHISPTPLAVINHQLRHLSCPRSPRRIIGSIIDYLCSGDFKCGVELQASQQRWLSNVALMWSNLWNYLWISLEVSMGQKKKQPYKFDLCLHHLHSLKGARGTNGNHGKGILITIFWFYVGQTVLMLFKNVFSSVLVTVKSENKKTEHI